MCYKTANVIWIEIVLIVVKVAWTSQFWHICVLPERLWDAKWGEKCWHYVPAEVLFTLSNVNHEISAGWTDKNLNVELEEKSFHRFIRSFFKINVCVVCFYWVDRISKIIRQMVANLENGHLVGSCFFHFIIYGISWKEKSSTPITRSIMKLTKISKEAGGMVLSDHSHEHRSKGYVFFLYKYLSFLHTCIN